MKAAFDAFYKLMASKPEHLPKANQLTVAFLCDRFRNRAERYQYVNRRIRLHFLPNLSGIAC